MPLIALPLSSTQVNRLRVGKNVRLSKHVMNENPTAYVDLDSRVAKKIRTRILKGKGFCLKSHAYSGTGIGRAFKKLGKKVTRGVSKVTREVKRAAPKIIKQVAHETGRAVEQGKKYVPRQVIKAGVRGLAVAATTAIGQPYLADYVTRVVNPAVDATYDTNLAHGSVGKNFGKNYVKNLSKSLITGG